MICGKSGVSQFVRHTRADARSKLIKIKKEGRHNYEMFR
jgi:hypothetical protein